MKLVVIRDGKKIPKMTVTPAEINDDYAMWRKEQNDIKNRAKR